MCWQRHRGFKSHPLRHEFAQQPDPAGSSKTRNGRTRGWDLNRGSEGGAPPSWGRTARGSTRCIFKEQRVPGATYVRAAESVRRPGLTAERRREGVRVARNNERHACGRRRVGELAGSCPLARARAETASAIPNAHPLRQPSPRLRLASQRQRRLAGQLRGQKGRGWALCNGIL